MYRLYDINVIGLVILNIFIAHSIGLGQELKGVVEKFDSLKINAMFENVYHRRTVREYLSTPVPKEHILKILDAARYAPTAGNVQPWKFVIIQHKKRIDSLYKLLDVSWNKQMQKRLEINGEHRTKFLKESYEAIQKIKTAPVYIIVFVDTTVCPEYAVYDGCLAVENLMLAARAMGYGTGFFTTYFPEGVVKEFLKAPDNLKFVCATPLGIPKEWPKTPPKKALVEFIVHESF